MLLDEINLAVHDNMPSHGPVIAHERLAPEPVQPESRTFGIPAVIWGCMATSYVLFFIGLILGTGHDGRAMFMIVISMLYTLMYFGTAFALNSLGIGDRTRQKSQWISGKFDTHTGLMSFGSVFGQMLIVPMMFALFGLGVAVIRYVVM